MNRRGMTATALLVAAFMMSVAHAMTPAERIAQQYLIIDTHIDVPYRLAHQWVDVTHAVDGGDFDAPRAKTGGLNLPFMSIYVPAKLEQEGGAAQLANQLIDSVEAMVARAPDKFVIVTSVKQAQTLMDGDKIGLALGIENGSAIEHSLQNLEHFYQRGVRYITLTHSKSNQICDSSYDSHHQWQGLSPFGEQVVKRMNQLGMMIDISHVSDEAFYDVLALSQAPLIATHSSARHFTPGWERNMSDDMIRALAAKGGVIQINIGTGFLTQTARDWSSAYQKAKKVAENAAGEMTDEQADVFERIYREQHPYPFASVADVADHIDWVVGLVGIDHVGIGTDFDGVGDSLPIGFKDVSAYPNLVAELLQRNYSEVDITKILAGNTLRLWRQVESLAAT